VLPVTVLVAGSRVCNLLDVHRARSRTHFTTLPGLSRPVRLIATIDDTSAGGLRSAGPAVIDKILRHLGLPVDPPLPTPSLRQGFGRQPARDPPWLAGALPGFNAGFAAGASPPDIWPH